MALQWFSVSMILIVLSLVQINAARYRSVRQTTPDQCANPTFEFCNFVQCENGGECVKNNTSVDCFKCNCAAGFTGRLCDVPIATPNGCNPPCLNGGTCQQSSSNTFTCVCPENLTGNQCQTSIIATHTCVTNPNICQNGGTCTVDQANYLCNCAEGFSGTHCEKQDLVSSCNSNPCGAHGTCMQAIFQSGPGIVCNCENRWTGKFCDVNLDDNCPIGFCQNGGVCRLNGQIPVCDCPSSYTGTRCETPTGTQSPITTTPTGVVTTPVVTTGRPNQGRCTANSCSNGGTCYNTGNEFICLCTSQWSGPTCTQQAPTTSPRPTTPSGHNACSPNPCTNGGTCYKHGTGYVCVCPSQYSGPTCAVAATTSTPAVTTGPRVTCANQPCQNGGQCYNTGTSYFCYCGTNSKFTGTNCETAISAVSSDCPLDCGSGYCVRSGSQQAAYACMCNGTLTPTRC